MATPNHTRNDLLSPAELSEYLADVPMNTLAQWRYLGKGPRYIKISGKHVRYRRSDVDAWLDAHTVGGAAS